MRIIFLLLLQVIAGGALATPAPTNSKKVAKPAPATPHSKLDPETRAVLQSISARYKKLRNWRANFLQESFSVGLGRGSANEGQFFFVAPNKFRYAIMRPEISDFISDGKQAWQVLYRKGRDKPAYVRHFADISGLDLQRYLFILQGIDADSPRKESELTTDFEIKGRSEDGQITLELTPKNPSEIIKITLIFKNEIEAPHRAVLRDAVGNKTTITIASFESLLSSGIDPKLFAPDYPKGSEIEEQK